MLQRDNATEPYLADDARARGLQPRVQGHREDGLAGGAGRDELFHRGDADARELAAQWQPVQPDLGFSHIGVLEIELQVPII